MNGKGEASQLFFLLESRVPGSETIGASEEDFAFPIWQVSAAWSLGETTSCLLQPTCPGEYERTTVACQQGRCRKQSTAMLENEAAVLGRSANISSESTATVVLSATPLCMTEFLSSF